MKANCIYSKKSLCRINSQLYVVLLSAILFLFPSKTFADCENNFVNLEVARTYLQENPYIIAFYSSIEGQSSYLFKVEKVYMEEEQMTVSGPVILIWNENSSRQRTYQLPDSGQVFTDELCGNYHYGYYKPMRAAFSLGSLLSPTGGIYNYHSDFWAFPEPKVIPNVEKCYSAWFEQLPNVIKDYCLWWNKNASLGPPILHELIDSVLSIPDGGRRIPPKVYIEKNHCPGEGCTYGKWKTTENIVVFKEPNSSKKTGTLLAGEIFTAISGNLYLTPIEQIVSESFEAYDSIGSILLEPGRKYYILSDIGEGHTKVWVNGRIMISSDSPYNSSQKWWVNIRTEKGEIGWILYPDSGCIIGSDYLE
jgi:hypothetical protein